VEQLRSQQIDVRLPVAVQLQVNQSAPNPRVFDSSGSSQAPETRLNRINVVALSSRLLRVGRDEPKPSAARRVRPRFGKPMQDRQSTATHPLGAAFQACEGE